MSQEILYTSAPQGLKPGSRGFCTVVSTAGMAGNLAERLEALSGYRHAFEAHDSRAGLNPVNFSHAILSVGGQRYQVLSAVRDAGLDYTQRTNKLAHIVALDPQERVDGGPAWVLATPGFCETQWDGQTRILRTGRRPAPGTRPPDVCRAWRQLTGDAGWAGVLAEMTLDNASRPVSVIYAAGANVLPLVVESMSLLPPEKRWDVTFSTYFTKLPAGVECLWRFLLDGTPEAQALRRNPHAALIDLCQPLPRAAGGLLVDAARQGTEPVWQSAPVWQSTPAAGAKWGTLAAPARAFEMSAEDADFEEDMAELPLAADPAKPFTPGQFRPNNEPPAYRLQPAVAVAAPPSLTSRHDARAPLGRLGNYPAILGMCLMFFAGGLVGAFLMHIVDRRAPAAKTGAVAMKTDIGTSPKTVDKSREITTTHQADTTHRGEKNPIPHSPDKEMPNVISDRDIPIGAIKRIPKPPPANRTAPPIEIPQGDFLPLPVFRDGSNNLPVELVRINVSAPEKCKLLLHGYKQLYSDQLLSLGEATIDERKAVWTVFIAGQAKGIPVGDFELKDHALKFEWRPSVPPEVNRLRYCVLEVIATDDSEKKDITFYKLKNPDQADPLSMSFSKSEQSMPIAWKVPEEKDLIEEAALLPERSLWHLRIWFDGFPKVVTPRETVFELGLHQQVQLVGPPAREPDACVVADLTFQEEGGLKGQVLVLKSQIFAKHIDPFRSEATIEGASDDSEQHPAKTPGRRPKPSRKGIAMEKNKADEWTKPVPQPGLDRGAYADHPETGPCDRGKAEKFHDKWRGIQQRHGDPDEELRAKREDWEQTGRTWNEAKAELASLEESVPPDKKRTPEYSKKKETLKAAVEAALNSLTKAKNDLHNCEREKQLADMYLPWWQDVLEKFKTIQNEGKIHFELFVNVKIDGLPSKNEKVTILSSKLPSDR